MNKTWLWLLACAGTVLLAACGASEVTPVTGCEPSATMQPFCGFQNPEDLASVPGTDELLVSEFGAMDGTLAGRLTWFDPRSGEMRPAWSGAAGPLDDTMDPDCTEPPGPAFSPHGIDVGVSGGKTSVLVVNHGGREAVERFAVAPGPMLTWRGCVHGGDEHWFNDVVHLPRGGFLVTHMMPRGSQGLATLKGLAGFDTGEVLRYDPGAERLEPVPGTAAPMPNGIEVSDDGKVLFVNVYLGGEVRKVDIASGSVLGTAEVPSPDNITWAHDGRLLVASHVDSVTEFTACGELATGTACGFAFEIVAIDPETMATERVYANRGAPMGAATVALDTGEALWLGSFAGDRIGRVEWPR